MRKEGWLVSYKHPDSEREFSTTYLNGEEAYRSASSSIKDWASEELENLRHQDDPEEWAEERESLTEILSLIERKSFKEAYEEWRSYADDTDPGEDVLIEGTTVVG